MIHHLSEVMRRYDIETHAFMSYSINIIDPESIDKESCDKKQQQ